MSRILSARRSQGFTLVELMMVVAVVGVLAAIVAVKASEAITRSKESEVKFNLGVLRAAINFYHADNDHVFPSTGSLAASLVPKYLSGLPVVLAGPHGHTNLESNALADTGGWLYEDTASGHIAVNCTHTDSKNSVWSAW